MYQVARPTALSAPHTPILKSSDIKPYDLAVALGLLEGDHYKALQPSDYLLHLSKYQSDKVKMYYEANEKVNLWVIKSILHYETVVARSKLVKFFINTALVSPMILQRNYLDVASQNTVGVLFDAKFFISHGDF